MLAAGIVTGGLLHAGMASVSILIAASSSRISALMASAVRRSEALAFPFFDFRAWEALMITRNTRTTFLEPFCACLPKCCHQLAEQNTRSVNAHAQAPCGALPRGHYLEKHCA